MEKKQLISFKPTNAQLAIIDNLRKHNYLMNQSDVIRMLIDKGAEAVLGAEKCRRIEAQYDSEI